MSWIEYVRRVAGRDAPQTAIAKAAQVTGPTVSRWLSGGQGVAPDAAANFARYYKRPVLEAFVAAGFLTEAEAEARPLAAPDYSHLTTERLVELMRQRIKAEVTRDAVGELIAMRDQELAAGDDPAAHAHIQALNQAIALLRQDINEAEGGVEHDRSAPTKNPDSGPDASSSAGLHVLPTAASKSATEPSVSKRRRRQDEAAEGNQDDGDFEPR